MDTHSEEIQQVIEDISIIRRTITRIDKERSFGHDTKPYMLNVNYVSHLIAFIFAAAVVVFEFFSNNLGTDQVLASVDNAPLRYLGMANIGLILVLLIGGLYFIVNREAKNSDKDIAQFIAKNFSYLKNLSLVSDVSVKFGVVSLIILGKQPQWLAVLFFLFLADYLIKGTFFYLPLAISITCGILCFICAAIQFSSGSPLLIWPMLAVALISGYALKNIKAQHKAVRDNNHD